MHISRLRLKNYRGFEESDTFFNDRFNVIIGDNATGKTALLDALAISISSFFLGIDGKYSKSILQSDIHLKTFSENLEPQLPVEIEATGEIDNYKITWLRDLQSEKGNTRQSKDTKQLAMIAKKKQKLVRNGEEVSLPVLAYYGTGRLWKEKKSAVNTKPKSSRFDGYIHALEPISNSKIFLQWMKTQEIAVLQKSKDPSSLVVVKGTIGLFLENTQRVYYDILSDTLMLEYFDENSRKSHLPWNMLSDGYRNVIAMAADLAYRCISLNPHLKEFATEKSTGIVLIDEIDLHLHPKWQRKIVGYFKKAFPEMQFISTTHSPFIIQSLKNEELIDLQSKDIQTDFYQKSLDEIVETEMHVENPIRSEKYKEMLNAAEKYYELLDQYKQGPIPEGVQRTLDEIEINFSSDPAYVALLKSERKSRLL